MNDGEWTASGNHPQNTSKYRMMRVSFRLANHDAFSQLISLQYLGDFKKGMPMGLGNIYIYEYIGKGIFWGCLILGETDYGDSPVEQEI